MIDASLSEAYFDACLKTRKVFQLLPELPPELQGRQLFIIKTCYHLSQIKKEVQISDIAQLMESTLPSITKSIADLEQKGYLHKIENHQDKRKINLSLTPKGLDIYQTYVKDFHEEQSQILAEIDPQTLELTIRTMNQVYDLLKKETEK